MGQSDWVAEPIIFARKRPVLAFSRISPPIMQLGRWLAPLYLRFFLRFQTIDIAEPQRILEALNDFQEKRTRLIVAFRHPYGDEPQLIFHVFNNLLPRLAKRSGRPLRRRPHLRMIHDYAVPLWGDIFIRFILPRVGSLPVYHVKFDPESLKRIRGILLDDACPLGIAPEGQITYHSETLPRIEQGTIRMGFWCARDLEKAGRPEKTQILPLSIHYRYDRRDLKKIRTSIARLETLCGLAPDPGRTPVNGLPGLQSAIVRIENRVLDSVEAFYKIDTGSRQQPGGLSGPDEDAVRQQRWEILLDAALGQAERILGLLPGSMDVIQRVYRIRHEGWERIYPEQLDKRLSRIERILVHRRAGEAWHAMRHMEFVDLMSYHQTGYLGGSPMAGRSFDRTVESVINLEDLVNRLRGGNITTRPNVVRKKAILMAAPCLDLTALLPEYQKNAKDTVRGAAEELRMRLLNCMEAQNHGTDY